MVDKIDTTRSPGNDMKKALDVEASVQQSASSEAISHICITLAGAVTILTLRLYPIMDIMSLRSWQNAVDIDFKSWERAHGMYLEDCMTSSDITIAAGRRDGEFI